jgi:hypothetical protein
MRNRFHQFVALLANLADRVLSRRANIASQRKRPRAKRPVRCWLERLEAREVFNATYHGGALIPHVEAQPVFLGSTWTSNATLVTEAAAVDNFVSYLVQSPYMDLMTDAGYNVGQGTATTGARVAATLAATVTDAGIRTTLQQAINLSLVSQPTVNRLYLIYIPSGVTVNNNGATSITTFLGYHGAFAGTDKSSVPFDIHYAVIPHPGTPNPTSASQGFLGLSEVQTLTLDGNAGGTLTPALGGVSATTGITRTDEVQTLTLGGTASGVVTLAYDGISAPAPLVPKTEVQQLTLGGTDGGIVRLSYNGVIGSEATKLTFQAGVSPTAADVLAHLNSLSALNGNVQVTGAAGGPFTITFGGTLAGANASQIGASATDGTTTSATTQTEGSISADEIKASLNSIPALDGNVRVSGNSGGPFAISFVGALSGQTVKTITTATTAGTTATIAVSTTASLPTAAQVQASLNTITSLAGNVTVTGSPGGPFTITVKNAGNIALLDVSHVTGGLTASITAGTDGGATADLDQLMAVTSHELAEAVTDPDVNYKSIGWFDDVNSVEIGDITGASTNTTRLGTSGFLTQDLFNQSHVIQAPDATSTAFQTVIVNGTPTTALQNVAATPLSLTRAQISWTPVTGAVGYRVFLVNGSQTTLLARAPGTASSLVISNLPSLVTLSLRVEAYNAAHVTDPTVVSLTMPLPDLVAPTITSAIKNPVAPQTSAIITWQGNGGAAGYRILLINGSRRTIVATAGEAATSATINGLTPGATVTFRVEAFRGSQIADSLSRQVVLSKAALVAPVVTIAAVNGNKSVVQLSWKPVALAQGYRVYRLSAGTRILVTTLGASATTTKIAGLPVGTSFQVEAFRGTLKAASKWVHL